MSRHPLNRTALVLALFAAACGGMEELDEELESEEFEATARVNVNLAAAPALAAVPGLDAAIAGRIVAGRDVRAYFTLADLKRIQGVSDLVYRRAQSRLTVGPSCGGRSNVACAAGLRCARKNTTAASTGVCVADVPQVQLLEANRWSIFAHDPSARYPGRLIYGYTDRTAGEFARASDRASLPWFRDGQYREAGHREVTITYGTPNPPGYYTVVNREVTVPAGGRGILWRLVFRCRGDGAGERDCGESEVAYTPVSDTARVDWAGQWGWRGYSVQGRGNPLEDDVVVSSSWHYPLTITVEAWAPGLTDGPWADGLMRAELETDLDISPSYAGTHPAPGGPLRRYPIGFEARTGNNWRFTWILPVSFHRNEWGQTYRFRMRFTTDGGRTWRTAGRGDGLSETFRTFKVSSPCADGGNGC